MLKKAHTADAITPPSNDAGEHGETFQEPRDLGDLLKLEPTPFDESLISHAPAQQELSPQTRPMSAETTSKTAPKPPLKDRHPNRDVHRAGTSHPPPRLHRGAKAINRHCGWWNPMCIEEPWRLSDC